jgi:hypothetical protein
MGDDDHVITAYRDHGHAIAVGMDTKPLMAELYGKAHRLLEGQGRLDALLRRRRAISGVATASSAARSRSASASPTPLKYQGKKGAAMAFMGDGAVNQGAVHEAYNLASLWNLPVVFVIENNGYSMGTSQARSSAGELAKRAAGYDMDWGQCQGARPLRGPRHDGSASSPRPATNAGAEHSRNRHLPLPRPLRRRPGQHLPHQGTRLRNTAAPRIRSSSSRANCSPRAC